MTVLTVFAIAGIVLASATLTIMLLATAIYIRSEFVRRMRRRRLSTMLKLIRLGDAVVTDVGQPHYWSESEFPDDDHLAWYMGIAIDYDFPAARLDFSSRRVQR